MAEKKTGGAGKAPAGKAASAQHTLMGAGEVRLFGVLIDDLEVRHGAYDPHGVNMRDANHMLQAQLSKKNSRFARIYGFSYEGSFYLMPKPALFLVHGPGTEEDVSGGGEHVLGIPRPIYWWSYDRWDHSVRMDVNTGPLYEILLNQNIDEQGLQSHYSGKLVAGRRGSLVD